MPELKEGITTGTCAAAAAKAAAILLSQGQLVKTANICLPRGELREVPINKVYLEESKAVAVVIKDGGDDPDITHGHEIVAHVEWAEAYQLIGGQGVGKVTKEGLAIMPGEAAINPVPRQMIFDSIRDIIKPVNVKVTITVPKGEELAKRTLNPKLGIVGGISILGTTGIVEPMSEEAYKNSLAPQLDIAKSAGFKEGVILVPGKMGELSAKRHLEVADEAVAQVSNFVGFMLEQAVKRGFKKILLWGHAAKLIKVAAGNMHTHNRISDARFEILAAHAALLGRGDLVKKIMTCNTMEEAIGYLINNNSLSALYSTANSAQIRAQEYLFNDAEVAVVYTNLSGDAIAWSNNIDKFLEEVAWRRKFMW